jgi:cation diffusion facilitator CzcD-associated flavoprotein CzcO
VTAAAEPGETTAILGAGLSGVCMGMQLRRAGDGDFVLYEQQPDVGGTWLRNTYPGLHCDNPSHLYSYSFEPNPDWSMVYAGRSEIQAYVRRCAESYGLIERTRFDTCVNAARWDDEGGRWDLELADGTVRSHRVVVAATGGLTEPHVPRIPGLDRFDGPLWHSGAWRHDVDLTGKRVAVVGSAASAVQVVPEVAKVAGELFVFSRTPNWVMPRRNAAYDEATRRALRSGDEQRRLRLRQYREALLWQGAFTRSPSAIRRLRELCLGNLRAAIDDPELVAALTPSYEPGCKRILVSDDYYPALAQPHVHLVPHGVEALTETSVHAGDGSETAVDVVILCTGYKLGGRADGRPALEVTGPDGTTLRQALGRRPEAYRGVAVPGFPNWFTVAGINGTSGAGSLVQSAELAAEFIATLVRRVVAQELHSLEVRADVVADYNAAIQAELQTMSWSGDCTNFYRDRTGRNVSFFPGTVGRYRRELRNADPDDFLARPRRPLSR